MKNKIRKIIFFLSIAFNIFFIAIFLMLMNRLGGMKYILWKATTGDRATGMGAGRADHLENLTINSEDIIFLGDSITQQAEWSEVFNDGRIKNRGIGGDTIIGIQNRISSILKSKPSAIFLMAGVNDLLSHSPSLVAKNIITALDEILLSSPNTKIYIQSILPVNNSIRQTGVENENIKKINFILKDYAENNPQIKFIDLSSIFSDSDHNLAADLTFDGIHLNGKGYDLWITALKSEIKELLK